MRQNRMQNKRKQFKDNADELPWDELAIDDQLVSSIRETYADANDETECQLSDWQVRLK